jgi:hypothetical protein
VVKLSVPIALSQKLPELRPVVRRSQAQQRLIALLGRGAEDYLRHLSDADRSLTRQIVELLELVVCRGVTFSIEVTSL